MAEVITYKENQIGGCVTVITAEFEEERHSIMIDYGSSLDGSDSPKDYESLWENTPPEAVFITHYHGDHVGRLLEIPKDVPIYMGETARQILINIEKTLSKIPDEKTAEIHREKLALLTDNSRIKTFKMVTKTYPNRKTIYSYEPVRDIPGFVVEPYSVDHSAYDAYMFLVEARDPQMADGKKIILHTGDFRGHGRLGKGILKVIEHYVHKNARRVDALVIEGTMMREPSNNLMSEFQMQKVAKEYLKQHKYAFLICSSTNLDSLASFYNALNDKRFPLKKYFYAYSNYIIAQLKTFSKTAGKFLDLYKFEKVYKLDLNRVFPWGRRKKTQKEIMEMNGFLALVKADKDSEKYIDPFIEDYKSGIIKEMPVIIYSMWNGYINSKHPAKKQEWIDFLDSQREKGVEILCLHTGGHSSPKMIEDVIKAVNPKEEIIPIHTENKEGFMNLNIDEKLKAKIRV